MDIIVISLNVQLVQLVLLLRSPVGDGGSTALYWTRTRRVTENATQFHILKVHGVISENSSTLNFERLRINYHPLTVKVISEFPRMSNSSFANDDVDTNTDFYVDSSKSTCISVIQILVLTLQLLTLTLLFPFPQRYLSRLILTPILVPHHSKWQIIYKMDSLSILEPLGLTQLNEFCVF